MVASFVKFIGLERDAATAVETHRLFPEESESNIIARVLGAQPKAAPTRIPTSAIGVVDVGQGIDLNAGETAYLFLSKSDAIKNRVAATAVVRQNGFELEGKIFPPVRGSFVQQPMKYIQDKIGHLGADGRAVSLSAYRQWHVVRAGRMVSLESLKAPEKARKRRTNLTQLSADELLEALGMTPT